MNFPLMQQPNTLFLTLLYGILGPPQQPYFNQWNPNWAAQQIPFPQQQQSLSLPSNNPPNNQAMRPQLPVQPNPNPNNNKAVQVIDIHKSTLSLPCNVMIYTFAQGE
jgi:hypothetical protein